jgi:hypothetical protein
MHQFNDLELWRERRRELLREAESGRLARGLSTRYPEKRAAGFWNALFGRVPDYPARLRAQGGGGA